MKSKTKIDKQMKKKTNSSLVNTILLCKKNEKWLGVASLLSRSKRQRINLNIQEIDKETKEGDTVLVPGKVLSQGEIKKKIKVVSLGFSENAREKLSKTKCEVSTILEEIKKNPKFEGIKILTGEKQ